MEMDSKILTILILFFSCLIISSFSYSHKLESRIFSGASAGQNEYPFVVSLRYYKVHHCGGSIITNRHILTAAHCINIINGTADSSNYSVFVGSNKLNKIKEVQIDWIKVNEGYKGQSDLWKNDLAIIKLKEPLKFDDSVKSINIRQNELISGNETLIAIGWGLVSQPASSLPTFQHKITVKHLLFDKCKNYWKAVSTSQLCFWSDQDTVKGICSADSGGPLIYENELVGVLSWRPATCVNSRPDVAVRLAPYFLEWIKENIHENF